MKENLVLILYIYKTLLVLGLASFVLVIIRDRMVVGVKQHQKQRNKQIK